MPGCDNCEKRLKAIQDELQAARQEIADVRLQFTDLKPLIEFAKRWLNSSSGKLASALRGKRG